jgi:hypothetical protein
MVYRVHQLGLELFLSILRHPSANLLPASGIILYLSEEIQYNLMALTAKKQSKHNPAGEHRGTGGHQVPQRKTFFLLTVVYLENY